ncbi:hypothetical protein [Mycolicibacterium llatzerense]|uniref:hypothetical protein n=1 Tax=Mycolicibacterium llatzerense TaxID=280871 RepID=UPI0013A6AFAE|nr:hypothetical protein [Mycolicibacterium llatzerense]
MTGAATGVGERARWVLSRSFHGPPLPVAAVAGDDVVAMFLVGQQYPRHVLRYNTTSDQYAEIVARYRVICAESRRGRSALHGVLEPAFDALSDLAMRLPGKSDRAPATLRFFVPAPKAVTLRSGPWVK